MSYKRMTRKSTWKHRDYHKYMQLIQEKVKESKLVPGEALCLTFRIPMPKSWSKKKRVEHKYNPHKQRPDIDNLVKAVLDALFYKKKGGDSRVWEIVAMKVWAEEGEIIIENI